MTIEDRVRRLLADAVADEPAPRGAPLERALRRRRGRPARVGAAALFLVLAAVGGLVAVRDRQRPLPAQPDDRGQQAPDGEGQGQQQGVAAQPVH